MRTLVGYSLYFIEGFLSHALHYIYFGMNHFSKLGILGILFNFLLTTLVVKLRLKVPGEKSWDKIFWIKSIWKLKTHNSYLLLGLYPVFIPWSEGSVYSTSFSYLIMLEQYRIIWADRQWLIICHSVGMGWLEFVCPKS